MIDSFVILAVNPGNTSTKIGVYSNDKPVAVTGVTHDDQVLKTYKSVVEQKEYRQGLIVAALERSGIAPRGLSCCVGRGGLLKPLASGTYRVNALMLDELRAAPRGEHASNLGAIIAEGIAAPLGIPAYIVDPVCVDEMQEVARLSGWAELRRESLSHALNQKAVAKRHAKIKGKTYEEMRLVVAHLGSGISISAHGDGRMIDVVNPRDEGPFSPDRAGGLPTIQLVKTCYSGKYGQKELEKLLFGGGGIMSYLGTSDLRKVIAGIDSGDEKSALVFNSMSYQIAKYIGAMATVLDGKVDCIIMTGGMANESRLVDAVKKRVSFISEVAVYPGEDELQALAEGALRVLRGEEEAKEYT